MDEDLQRKEREEHIQDIMGKLHERVQTHFDEVKHLLKEPFNYPLLDNIREEIVGSILINSSQGAITLTNHLLEKALKAFLIESEPRGDLSTIEKFEAHYKAGNDKYDNLVLHETINQALAKNLITAEQAAKLHEFRDKFRNAFGHATAGKIFEGKKKKVYMMNAAYETKFHNAEVNVPDFPFLHDLVQKEIANEEAVPYFTYVDEVIRHIMGKLFKMD